MQHFLRIPRRRRAILFGLLALLVIAAVWAPVPSGWQLDVRIALGMLAYVVLVGEIVRDALETFDPHDPALSARARARIRALAKKRHPQRSLAPTPIQQLYLETQVIYQRPRE